MKLDSKTGTNNEQNATEINERSRLQMIIIIFSLSYHIIILYSQKPKNII